MPISTPLDAVTVTAWTTDHGEAFRTFVGSSWRVPFTGDVDLFGTGPDIEITINGQQFADGRCSRWVVRGDLPKDIPPAKLRLLAEAFADAHAEIDRFNNTPVFSAAR